jgi:hypothetical protein
MSASPQLVALGKTGEIRRKDPTLYQALLEIRDRVNASILNERGVVDQAISDSQGHTETVTLVNGLNSDVLIQESTRLVRIIGPTAAFSIGGFSCPTKERPLFVHNTTAQAMTVVDEDAGSHPSARISTLRGNLALGAGPKMITVCGNSIEDRWILAAFN